MELETPILGVSPTDFVEEDGEVIENRVREICEKWEFDDHSRVLEMILKPYKEMCKSYLQDNGYDEFSEQQLRESNNIAHEKQNPKIDIELEYFVPGLSKSMLDLLYWKFVQFWDIKIDYAVKALRIKIRSSFEADESDSYTYFDDLGEVGGYIRLFWRENA